MHDGSVHAQREAVDLHDRGGVARPRRAAGIRPLGLSEGDKPDLLAFGATLTAGTRSPPPPANRPTPGWRAGRAEKLSLSRI